MQWHRATTDREADGLSAPTSEPWRSAFVRVEFLSIVVVLVALRIPGGIGRRSCYSAKHAVSAQATRAKSGKDRTTRA